MCISATTVSSARRAATSWAVGIRTISALPSYESIETLIELGADRLLTSGLKPKAVEGKALLGALQSAYGNSIEILAGSGINASNARMLMEETGIRQVHSSCKDWMTDSTTTSNGVTYGFAEPPHANCYDVVSETLVRQLLDSLGELGR